MTFKLIAADMDGTLLNDNGIITSHTIEVIKKVVAKGVIFTISTGRPIQGVDKYNDILNLKAPIITYNGAMIVHSDTREILFSKNLLYNDAIKILKIGNEMGITMIVWVNNKLYCNVFNEKVDDYKKLSDVEPILINDYNELAQSGITKILWYDQTNVIANIQKKLEKVAFDKVTYCTSKPTFLEFFNSEVSKAEAMKIIGELYGIKQEEMIAIGDGYNDLPMIKFAKLGVAMKNAPEEVKQLADYITEHSNNGDAIAEIIEKFIL